MANDTFPVQTSISGKGKTQRVVAQLDLTSLEDALSPVLTPGSDLVETDASRPAVANPTKGPHRYTIFVPYDDGTRLSLGNGVVPLGQAGITADTKSHIHLSAFEGEHATTLSLGLPTLTQGSDLNKQTTGYSLDTEGASQHQAKEQVVITSKESSITLGAAQNVGISSAEGGVTVEAEKPINVKSKKNVSITASEGSPFEHQTFWSKVQAVARVAFTVNDFASGPVAAQYGEDAGTASEAAGGAGGMLEGLGNDASENMADWIVKNAGDKISTALNHIEATVALVLAGKKLKKEAEEKKAGWRRKAVYGKYVAAVVAELVALKSDIKDIVAPESDGCVSLTADKNVSIDADHSFKATSSTIAINGTKAASVSGTLSASLKAHKTASVFGGFGTSIKAMAGNVEVGSDFKEVKITAKKEISIASEAAEVKVTGEEDVQLNSIKKAVFAHGKEKFYAGVASGDAFGLVIKPAELMIGQVSDASEFEKAKGKESDALITVKTNKLKLRAKDGSEINVESEQVRLKSGKVKLNASDGNVTVMGQKILLG